MNVLFHVMLRNSLLLYKTIVLLARETFKPKNQVCAEPKKIKLFDRKVINFFQLMMFYTIYSTLKV